MLNTGLALLHPYHSLYSRYRCFLMSNGHLTLAGIKQALQQHAAPGDYRQPGYLVALAEDHQQRFCNALGIPYHAPAPIPLSVPVRNCSACAAIGYHSRCFEWRWVSHCPVHRLPLVEHCSRCHQRWPALTALANRNCPLCGRGGYDLNDSLPTLNSPYAALSIFDKIEQEYRCAPRFRLRGSGSTRFALDYHDPVPIDHPMFASVFCTTRPELRSELLALGVPFADILAYRFSCTTAVADAVNVTGAEAAHSRAQVAAQIQRGIETLRGKPLRALSRVNMEYDGMDQDTDCYRYAYLYWRNLVTQPPGVGIHRGHESRFFQMNAPATYPLIPCPMDTIEHLVALEHAQFGTTEVMDASPVPLALHLLVYKLDLWVCFKSLLTYFERLKQALLSSSGPAFYDHLPPWAQPGACYSDGISLYREADTWVLLVPRHYCQLTFSDQFCDEFSLLDEE